MVNQLMLMGGYAHINGEYVPPSGDWLSGAHRLGVKPDREVPRKSKGWRRHVRKAKAHAR